MNKEQPQEILMKVMALGPSGAGKVLKKIIIDFNVRFTVIYEPTIGCDFNKKKMLINNEPVRLLIWDTAGQEKHGAILKAYYRESHGIIFTFDITSEQSFQDVQKFHERAMEQIKNMNLNISRILIGCKNDLEDKRKISFDVATAYAQSQGMQYIETSAKTGTNCVNATDNLAYLCYEQIKTQKVEEKLQLEHQKISKMSSCF